MRTSGCRNAESIVRAAIERVDPMKMIAESLVLDESVLQIRAAAQTYSVDLADFHRVIVLGAGKAGATMTLGLEEVLGDWITDGVVAVKAGHTGNASTKVRLVEAGHPVPDRNSVHAAREVLRLAESADEGTLCIALISGGGSSLLTLPASFEGMQLTLEDIQVTTQLLLGAGTPIGEINCVRKHLSGISGGRFCRVVAPATLVALILSDVVGDDLASIASGLASPDNGTYQEAYQICARDGIADQLPKRVREMLLAGMRGEIPETPKPGDPAFERVHPLLIGTNSLALDAARQCAEELGYNTLVLTSRLTGEAREVGRVLAGIAADIAAREVPLRKPACLLAGGETTVTLRGSGKGGRNQEMALSFLEQIAAQPEAFRGVSFLSAGTDGNDGPTDAAGAWATPSLAERSNRSAISEALADNDSYHFFDGVGGLLKTGPTNTNVCDIQVLLVE